MEYVYKCPLCGKKNYIKVDKKGNLYFKCLDFDCGVIMFVYGKKGMRRLKELSEQLEDDEGVIV